MSLTDRFMLSESVPAEPVAPARDREVDELTPEELSRRKWLADSPRQLAARIPNSVFALGQEAHERVA